MTENVDADGPDASHQNESALAEDDPSPDPDPATDPTADDDATAPRERLVTYLQWSLFAILLLVVLVATFRLYFSASTAIDRFVSDQFRPLFQAAFNLAVLLLAGLGLSVLVRRMT